VLEVYPRPGQFVLNTLLVRDDDIDSGILQLIEVRLAERYMLSDVRPLLSWQAHRSGRIHISWDPLSLIQRAGQPRDPSLSVRTGKCIFRISLVHDHLFYICDGILVMEMFSLYAAWRCILAACFRAFLNLNSKSIQTETINQQKETELVYVIWFAHLSGFLTWFEWEQCC